MRNERGGLVPDHNLAYDRAQADGATVGWTLGGPAVAARTLSASRDAAFRTATLSDGPVSAVYAYGPSRGGVTSVLVRVHGADVLRHSFAWHRGLGVRTNLAATLAAPGTPPVALPCFGLPRDPGTNRIVRVLREDGSHREVEYEDGRLTRWTCRRADGSTDAARSFAYAYDGAGDVLRGGPVNDAGEGRAAFAPGDLNLHVERRWNAVDLVGYAPADAAVTANGVPAARDGERFRFVFPLADPSPASTTNLLVCAAVPQPDGTERYAELPVLLRLPAMPETIDGDTAGVTASDSLTEYRYDARGRLRCVTDKLASVPRYDSVYDYYPDGRRARKTVSVWQNNAWQPTYSSQYLYDRWNLIQEHTQTPSPPYSHTLSYTWGLDLAGLETGDWSQDAGGIGGLLAITEVAGASTNVFLPVCDQVGTVHALVAAVTNSVALAAPFVAVRYEYSPYGELLEADVSPHLPHSRTLAFAHSLPGFQSKLRDPETGFWYFGYRFFDSRCAQWLTHDPLREGGGFNLAAFCGGDPVNQVDPLGLEMRWHSWSDPTTGWPRVRCVDDYDLFYLGYERAVLQGEVLPWSLAGVPVGDQPVEALQGESIRMVLGNGWANGLNGMCEFFPVALGTLGNTAETLIGAGLVSAPEASGLTKVGGAMLIGDALDRQWAMMSAEPTLFEQLCATYMTPDEVGRANLLKNGGMLLVSLGTAVPGANGCHIGTVGPRSAGVSRWISRPPGVQVRRVGRLWVKRVNPESNALMRWWGRHSIDAQYRGLQSLGEMATPHGMRNGMLFTRDVGRTLPDGYRMLNATSRRAYFEGSRRMGTFFNDIQPRNMGLNGLIFDPAIDPVTKLLFRTGVAGSAYAAYEISEEEAP